MCVTRDQFKALLEGSVLGAHTESEEAADASGSGETEAPSGPSIVNGEKNMDTASSTPLGAPAEAEPIEPTAVQPSPGTIEAAEPPVELSPTPEPVPAQ